jgi:hypothetical protein
MAHVKKGNLTASPEWRKHLREAKRWFWRRERRSEQALAREEADRETAPRVGETGSEGRER